MKELNATLLVLGSVFLAAEGSAAVRPLDGATMVRATGESRVQMKAADELSKHLGLIFGRPPAEAVKAGEGLSFVFAKPDNAPDAAPFEARYRIDGKRVWFWGDESKGFPGNYPGSQFAVYCFLEEYFGVRWVAPGDKGISFSRMRSVDLPEKRDFAYKPPFAMEILRSIPPRAMARPSLPIGAFLKFDPVPVKIRMTEQEMTDRAVADGEWRCRQRHFSPDSPSYGHAFTKWQPRFRDTHPEYLALNEKGSRVQAPLYDAWIKLCISNEAVVDQIIEDWKAEGCPHYINVCENDGGGFCRCENCLKLDADRPGEDFLVTKTDRYLNFYNRVAKKAVRIRPDVQVSAYIYSFYRHPPRRERIEYPDNMVFGAVPSLSDDIRAFFADWKKVGLKQFFFRPNFHTSHGTLPAGTEKDIYDIFRTAVANGLIGVDFDACLWRDVMAPEAYVTARMIAYPGKSFEELMDELCSAYGEAKPAVAGYYARIRARREAGKKAANDSFLKKNMLDDSGFVTEQTRIHSLKDLWADMEVLRQADRPSSPEAAARLDDLIVRAKHYILCYSFLEAGTHKDDAKLAEIGRKLLKFRLLHPAALQDVYEITMNSRYSGTEGHLWQRIPEVLKEFGGYTPREELKMYN